jgi:hypothetical protein
MLNMSDSAQPAIVSYLYHQVEDKNYISTNPETQIEYEDESNLVDKMEDNLAEVDRERNPALVNHHHISLDLLGKVR